MILLQLPPSNADHVSWQHVAMILLQLPPSNADHVDWQHVAVILLQRLIAHFAYLYVPLQVASL